jgi:hypothetical protein
MITGANVSESFESTKFILKYFFSIKFGNVKYYTLLCIIKLKQKQNEQLHSAIR